MADNDLQPSMTADQLLAGWTPRRVGRRIVLLAETESTNTAALTAAGEPEADGLAILADVQTAGRGRLGAAWVSPRAASVLCSVVLLSPETQAEETIARTSAWLTHLAAVAGCDAIRQATDVTPAIKWPNDLRVGGKKIGGILIETRPVDPQTRAWVVGIGINCLQHAGHFPDALRATASSLELASHHPVDRTAVARELLKALDRRLAPELWGQTESVHADWLAYAEPIGQKVRLRRNGSEYAGWTVEVDPVGGLIVRLQTGQLEWFDPMRTTLL